MPQYTGHNENSGSNANGGTSTKSALMANGYSDQNSPNSSQLSSGDGQPDSATLISRTQKQHTTQQVTTTTKTIREIQYIGPDGQPLEYVPAGGGGHPRLSTTSAGSNYEHIGGQPGEMYQGDGYGGYYPQKQQQQQQQQGYPNYAEYPHRPPTPPSPSDRSSSPPPQHREPDYMRQGAGTSSGGGGGGGGGVSSTGPGYPPRSGYDELDTTLMPPRPGEQYGRGSPGPSGSGQAAAAAAAAAAAQHFPGGPAAPGGGGGGYAPMYGSIDDQQQGGLSLHGSMVYDPNLDNSVFEDNNMSPMGAPRAMFDEEEAQHEPPPMMRSKSSLGAQSRGVAGVHWRDPDLHEVIEFLNNPNSVIKANAAAYLQHLCYMDDPVKAKTRQLGGIPPLVALLSHDIPEIHRNACGALRNLSYGRQNDENKRAIKNAGGVTALVRLLRKATPNENEVKELVTGVLWNLSSCDDLKKSIIDEALLVLVNIVIIPHSGWDPNGPGGDTHWTTVFRNSSGILRNVSSAGDYGRKKLRECDGLVDSVLYLVKKAIEKANIDNKSVENCVCVLRNLSYRSQEIEDPNYDKKQLLVGETRAGAKPNSDNLGCFGAGKTKRKDSQATPPRDNPSSSRGPRTGPSKGMDLLWQPEVVQPYLNLLSNCSNPETLEAAAGAIQNLSACYWQPSIDIRAAVRKEKGLPILVELLRMEVDRVVCAVATALRNLAIDQRNKELIGKYAMRDLVQKLPSGNPQHDHGTSDDTIAAVLATLNEVIKKHPEFSRSLLEAGGVDRLMTITRQRQRFSPRVVKFASQVLYSMWVHQELREVYRKAGWKEQDFVTKTVAARNARPNSPTNLNSTLNRPMASQSGTRYEDRTMQRGAAGGGAIAAHMNNSAGGYGPEEVQMQNMSLYGGNAQQQAMYPPGNHLVRPGEPVYAQVNRDKKKNSRSGGGGNHVDQQQQQHQMMMGHPHHHYSDYSEHADHWHVNAMDPTGMGAQQVVASAQHNPNAAAAGDSWV